MSAERRGLLCVAAAALLWSTGGLGIKLVPEPPLTIACWRSATAALALFVLLRPRRWRWSAGFAIGVVSSAACMTTFVLATKWTSAANAIFLQYCGVAWVMLLSPRLLGEPLERRDAAAVAAAFCGMLLFFAGRLEARGVAGELAALASSVFFASMILALRAERGVGAEAVVAYGNLLAAAALLPVVRGDLLVAPRSAAILVLLGVGQIGLAYALFVAGLRHVTATQAALVGMLEPVANPVWVFLFLGEAPAATSIAGGAVVLAAIAWRTLGSGAAVATPPPD